MVQPNNHPRLPRPAHYPLVDAATAAQVAARPEGVPAGARGARRVPTYLAPTAASKARGASTHPPPPIRPAPTSPAPNIASPPTTPTPTTPIPTNSHPTTPTPTTPISTNSLPTSPPPEDEMGKFKDGLSRRLSKVNNRLSRLGNPEINDEGDTAPLLAVSVENDRLENDGEQERGDEGHEGGDEEVADPNMSFGNYDFGEDYMDRLDGPMPQWYYDKYYGAKMYRNSAHILDVTEYQRPAQNVEGRNSDLAFENVMSWRDVYSEEPVLYQPNLPAPPGPTNDVVADLEAKLPSDDNVIGSDTSDRASEVDLDEAFNDMHPPMYDGRFVGDLGDDERPPELRQYFTEQRPKHIHKRDIVITHHNQIAVEKRRRAATKVEYDRQEERKRIELQLQLNPRSRKESEIPDKPYLHRGTPEWEEMEKVREWVIANAKAKAAGLPEPPNKPITSFPKPPRGYVETDHVPEDFRRNVHKAFGTLKESGLKDEDESSSEEEGDYVQWIRELHRAYTYPTRQPGSRSSNSLHNSEDDQPPEESEPAPPVPAIRDKKSYTVLGKKELGEGGVGKGKLKRDRSFVDIVGSAFKQSSRLPQSKTMPNFAAKKKDSISKPSNASTIVLGTRPTVTSEARPKTPENQEEEQDIYGVSPETRLAYAAYNRNKRNTAQASRASTDNKKSGLYTHNGESFFSGEVEMWDAEGNPYYWDRSAGLAYKMSPSGRILPLPDSPSGRKRPYPVLESIKPKTGSGRRCKPEDVPRGIPIYETDGVSPMDHPLYGPTVPNQSDRSNPAFGCSSRGSTTYGQSDRSNPAFGHSSRCSTSSSRQNTRDRPTLTHSHDTQTSMATKEVGWDIDFVRPSPDPSNGCSDRSGRVQAPNTSSSSRSGESMASPREDHRRDGRSSLPGPSYETARPRHSRPSTPLSRAPTHSPDFSSPSHIPENVNRRYSGIPRPSVAPGKKSGNKAREDYDFFGHLNADLLLYDKNIAGGDEDDKKESTSDEPQDIASIIAKELKAIGAPERSRKEIMRHFGDAASIVSSKTLPNLDLGGRLRKYIPNKNSPTPRNSIHGYTRLADEAPSSDSFNADSRPQRGPPSSASVPNLSGRPSHQDDRSRREGMASHLRNEQLATEHAELSRNGKASFNRTRSPDSISGLDAGLNRSWSTRAQRSSAVPPPSISESHHDLDRSHPAYQSIPPPDDHMRRSNSSHGRARPVPMQRLSGSFGGGGFSISNPADRIPSGRQSLSPGARGQYASMGSRLAPIPSEGNLAAAYETGGSDVGRMNMGTSGGPSVSGSDSGRRHKGSSSLGASVGRSGAGMSHNAGHYNTGSSPVRPSDVGHSTNGRSTHRTSTSGELGSSMADPSSSGYADLSNAGRIYTGSSSVGTSVGRSGAGMSHNVGHYNVDSSPVGPSDVGSSSTGRSTHRTSTSGDSGSSVGSSSSASHVNTSNAGRMNTGPPSVGSSTGHVRAFPAAGTHTGNVDSSAPAGSASVGSSGIGSVTGNTPTIARSTASPILPAGPSTTSYDDDADITFGPDANTSWASLRNSIHARMEEANTKRQKEEAKKQE